MMIDAKKYRIQIELTLMTMILVFTFSWHSFSEFPTNEFVLNFGTSSTSIKSISLKDWLLILFYFYVYVGIGSVSSISTAFVHETSRKLFYLGTIRC